MKRIIMSLALAGALVFSAQPQQAHANEMDRTVGTIIGAVGGGILGSTLGKGQGRVVATAAGTVIGAVLGREIASNDYDNPPRRKVIYRDAPPKKVVVYKERPPKKVVVYKEPKYKKNKKWKRVAHYDGDVLVCNKKGKRCHWYD